MKKSLSLCFFICALCFFVSSCTPPPSTYPKLMSCLDNNNVVMFGASWCPHCAEQKKLFGKSVKQLPYFECAAGNAQVQECIDRAIMSYPTWQFPENALKSLPKEDLATLVSGEIQKAEAGANLYKASNVANPENTTIITGFLARLTALKASNIGAFEKLTSLKILSEGEQGALIERPLYSVGRIAGQRPISDIALYSGCMAEYQNDISAAKK